MENLSVSLKKPLLQFSNLGTSSRQNNLRQLACLHFTLTILLGTVVLSCAHTSPVPPDGLSVDLQAAASAAG